MTLHLVTAALDHPEQEIPYGSSPGKITVILLTGLIFVGYFIILSIKEKGIKGVSEPQLGHSTSRMTHKEAFEA